MDKKFEVEKGEIMDLGMPHGGSGIELDLGSEALYLVPPNISEGWLPHTVFVVVNM